MIVLKKILFSDLFGTLINKDMNDSKKYYNSVEKEFSIVSRYMNEFLKEGNYIAVVTEPGGHGNFGRVFNNQIAKLNSYIDEDLRSHLAYYLQGNGTISPEDNIRKEMINGKRCYIGEHPLIGIAVDKKEEAIGEFLKTIPLPYQIYGIGDSAKDIPMLLKIQELRGKSSLIDNSLYQSDRTTDEIINNELDVEFHFEYVEILKNLSVEERLKDELSEQQIEWGIKREKRKQELYQLLSEGNLDLDELIKNYSKFIECRNYEIENNNRDSGEHPFYENYPISEAVIEKFMSIPCYPTFTEYYTKVLRKK